MVRRNSIWPWRNSSCCFSWARHSPVRDTANNVIPGFGRKTMVNGPAVMPLRVRAEER